jgi:asparagine synthase (glutamine-hydrolysing)
MCGITGTIGIGDVDVVQRMTDMLSYRGPDDAGLYHSGDVCFGHRRLSIIDLSPAGHQPMLSEDGRAVLTYNGEIYNYLELRAELEKKGRRFRSESDTETILVAYEEYGLDCLQRLDGMFAFALWDDRQERLVLARDALGVKPLFYHVQETGIAFASELKALCLVPGLKRQVNRKALRSAMRFASNYEVETMLTSVHKLLPGQYLTWHAGEIRVDSYWQHPVPNAADWNEEQACAEIRKQLGESVKSQMISDVPVGAALSGGLDSSVIVALMAETGGTIDTFTVGHGEDDPDLINARIVAEHFKTNHHEILVESQNIADLLPRVVWHLDEPLGHMDVLQMFVNYREASKFVNVLLVGEGADECFGGYARYKLFSPKLKLPASIRNGLYQRVYLCADEQPPGLAGIVSRGAWDRMPASPLLDPHPRFAGPQLDADRNRALALAMNYDQRVYLPHCLLKRADSTGMAHSLELRVPFLSQKVVEMAARVPPQMMLKGGQEKYILRKATEPLLPSVITQRPKHPLQMQLDSGLQDTLDLLCDSLLKPADVRARGFFDPHRVDRLRRGRPRRFAPYVAHRLWSNRVWAMILCEMWARIFVDCVPGQTPPADLAEVLSVSA